MCDFEISFLILVVLWSKPWAYLGSTDCIGCCLLRKKVFQFTISLFLNSHVCGSNTITYSAWASIYNMQKFYCTNKWGHDLQTNEKIPREIFRKNVIPGNTEGGSITVQLTSCLIGLESAVWLLTIFFAQQANPNQSNRRSMVQWYIPFSIPGHTLTWLLIAPNPLIIK
jgi:hypothetical protein